MWRYLGAAVAAVSFCHASVATCARAQSVAHGEAPGTHTSFIGGLRISGGAPATVAQATSGWLWFPQAAFQFAAIPDATDSAPPVVIVHMQACADELHPEGWAGSSYYSADGGVTWKHAADLPRLNKACFLGAVEGNQSSLLCTPYPLLPHAGPNGDAREGGTQSGRQWTATFDAATGVTTVALSDDVVTLQYTGFKRNVSAWGPYNLAVVDGTATRLPDGSLLLGVYGKYEGDAQSAVTLFKSTDGGREWAQLSVVSAAGADPACTYGLTEHDFEVLADGRVMGVFRTHGGSNVPMCYSFSADGGATWTALKPFAPGGPHGVEPKLALLANGMLVVSGGRFGLFLWVSPDGAGASWVAFNVAAHHNAAISDPSLQFDAQFVNATANKGWSTSYTSIVPMRSVGEGSLLYCYDRLANGWKQPPGPYGKANTIFCVRLDVAAAAA